MSGWTKGPWTYSELKKLVRDSDGKVVVWLDLDTEECEANARLIAAAPEMVEVLDKLAKYENGHEEYACERQHQCVCGLAEVVAVAVALLAKVRGESA